MPRSTHLNRIKTARAQLLDHGVVSGGLLPEPIERSWSRCASTGLSLELKPLISPLTQQELNEIRGKNSRLLHQARPEMENLHTQIYGTQNMVILTDAGGTILHALGHPDFISKAQRVALQPGVSWREENTGTNAIGTALVEQTPVFVMGAEHYFNQNAFLNCSAAPIFDPYGQTIGILDVSGDYRQPQEQTMALVRMSAQMIENRLFSTEFSCDITVHFHARPEFIGTLWEGIAVFSPDGKMLAINKCGKFQLGLTDNNPVFEAVFDGTLAALMDAAKRALPHSTTITTRNGQRLYLKVESAFSSAFPSRKDAVYQSRPKNPISYDPLNALDSGDAKMQRAIHSVKKILGRNIAVLIEGETGTGKELLAKAIHASGPHSKGAFVAINCASIPDGLIEAELFGYEEGAFTGAKRHGTQGKILQANGGTLFLDEIGEMPLVLQARLLRVLQEREIVPLGASKGITVDIAVISATNKKLRELVDLKQFREDLYYRLNGLRITLPPLRERTDLEALISRVLQEECDRPLSLDQELMSLFKRHPWRGNVRQLRNVLRAALAFVEEENYIRMHHLPDDFIEEFQRSSSVAGRSQPKGAARIADAEIDLIRQALQDHAGNMTQAARQLGISRATLYRKTQKLKQI